MKVLIILILTVVEVPSVVEALAVSDIKVQQDFDIGRFQGKWYIWKQYVEAPLPEDGYQSREHIYTECAGTHLNTLSIGRNQVNDCRYGVGALHRPNLTGTDAAKMRYQPSKKSDVMLDYWVVDTDYDNYAVIYGCNQVNETSGKCDLAYSWILDRSKEPCLTTEILNKINYTIEELCLRKDDFDVVAQSDERCRQCEQKYWTPQPNFQLDKYMGAWYEMAFKPRRPLPDEYRYNDFVHVYTDQPNNTVSIRMVGSKYKNKGECFIKDGVSSLDKTGTPTKFLFYEGPDRSVYQGDDYWVIETDYTGYAFVLGCVRDATTPYDECVNYNAWVFSRKPSLYGDQFLKLTELFDRYCLNEKEFFAPSHHIGCPQDPAYKEKTEICVKYNKEDVSMTKY